MNDYSVTLKSDKTLEVQGSLRSVIQLDALITVLSGMREIAFQGAGGNAGHDEQLYDVILTKTGDCKFEVIKAIRTLNGMGLLQAKKMAESNRYELVLNGISHSKAQQARCMLNNAGAMVDLRHTQYGMREVAFQGTDTDIGITHDSQFYDVILKKTGDRKIAVMEEISALTGLNSWDAKQLVDADFHRVILRRVSHHVAQQAYHSLNGAGATVEFRNAQ